MTLSNRGATRDAYLIQAVSDVIIDSLSASPFFSQTHHRDFGYGIDAERKLPGHALHVVQLEHVGHRHSSLVHARAAERGEPDHIPGCIDVRHLGSEVLIDLQQLTRCDL
jgi:hypothetical protein